MFNESEWLKLVFLLADTQSWLNDLVKEAVYRLPLAGNKKFMNKTYYFRIKAMAHILERHYYKINRYPHAGKFHIPVIEIIDHIREAYIIPPLSLTGTLNYYRVKEIDQNIGFDKTGQSTNIITILTDAGGNIITAFPGGLSSHNESQSQCK